MQSFSNEITKGSTAKSWRKWSPLRSLLYVVVNALFHDPLYHHQFDDAFFFLFLLLLRSGIERFSVQEFAPEFFIDLKLAYHRGTASPVNCTRSANNNNNLMTSNARLLLFQCISLMLKPVGEIRIKFERTSGPFSSRSCTLLMRQNPAARY